MSPKNPSLTFRPFNVQSITLQKKGSNSSVGMKGGGVSDKTNHREARLVVKAPSALKLSPISKPSSKDSPFMPRK